MALTYYHINPKAYDGFRYQISLMSVPWDAINWCYDDLINRRIKMGEFESNKDRVYVELKREEDLTYFLLRWS